MNIHGLSAMKKEPASCPAARPGGNTRDTAQALLGGHRSAETPGIGGTPQFPSRWEDAAQLAGGPSQLVGLFNHQTVVEHLMGVLEVVTSSEEQGRARWHRHWHWTRHWSQHWPRHWSQHWPQPCCISEHLLIPPLYSSPRIDPL